MKHSVQAQSSVSATLPLELSDGVFLDRVKARQFGESLAEQYSSANPYPHIVIDNFLPVELAEKILAEFPSQPLKNDHLYTDKYSHYNKRQVLPMDCKEYVRNIFNFFNSAPILQFLEGLTTIKSLLPDPYFNGGGFHEIFNGGKLAIHADFRVNEKLHLARRINVLIYLNKDWQEEYGGCLEIWDRAMKNKIHSIAPIFNRCVIFNTDSDSYHGHPDALTTPENVTRKSMALYYYTASENIYHEVPPSPTKWMARASDPQDMKIRNLSSRLQEIYLKDFLPPILYRGIEPLKRSLRKIIKRSN